SRSPSRSPTSRSLTSAGGRREQYHGVFVPVSPGGPNMRRRRGELPPPRQPRLNAFRVAKFAHRLFNEKAEEEWRNLAAADWRAFVNRRFKLTDDQRGALAAMDEAVVARIAEAVRQLLE